MSGGSKHAGRKPNFWAGMGLAIFAFLIALNTTGAINRTTTLILLAIPIFMVVLYVRALGRQPRTNACAGMASIRYTRGIAISSAAYLVGLGTAMSVWRNYDPSTAVTWLLAMLPIAPIFWMIYVMGRYIVEETDEYLRHRAVLASLVGLGFVLAIGSFWGFLETFELVPHVPGWWAVPIWAVGMGLGQGWLALRDRAGGEE
ncbi:hypothetical protein [Allopontixanthobacter sediminis]|uniref:Uncharacterized protein n=1 Tax=Allopontixanthobacter sediminis TaxID=1689985 RepID=A0A845B267_9SPHN|nr:hypothetical protein [Allopontixanthobacter sediminis]MXP44675.1 hypothetical protein [Allopontixanthobacter sediminis]